MKKRQTQIIIISDNTLFSNLMKLILANIDNTELVCFTSIENAENTIFQKNDKTKLIIIRINKIIKHFQLKAIKKLNQNGEGLKMIVIQQKNKKLASKANDLALNHFKNDMIYNKLIKGIEKIVPKTFNIKPV